MNKQLILKQSKVARTLSINNRFILESAGLCGCFYCCAIFPYADIKEWINDALDQTAVCPYCQIDSVIPKNEQYSLTTDFLNFMYQQWFNE
ncbi:TPA: cytoplasmic protein [Listeria monocytogenes]|uniref:cytoplasmic protein n=1 Tax=Listeria monocytogenes TaxID=1639 RepID=UPI000E6C819C|nr:cytoplasmic protein [Listeria monocytogenes]RJA01313.1 cytoplasmic protein [Listeria monocytogenes]HAA9139782.1 cytoplasmic protein [Listeria monocytogenes]